MWSLYARILYAPIHEHEYTYKSYRTRVIYVFMYTTRITFPTVITTVIDVFFFGFCFLFSGFRPKSKFTSGEIVNDDVSDSGKYFVQRLT